MCSHSQTHTSFSWLFTAHRRLISDLLTSHIRLSESHFLPLSLSLHHAVLRPARSSRSSILLLHACFLLSAPHSSSFGSFSFRPACTSSTHPPLRPWSPPPSPIAVLTPVRNSSSSLSSHVSSEAANVGSLLILADGMVVEHADDFYRMQVSGTAATVDRFYLNLSWLMKTKMFTFTYHDRRLAPPPPASAPPTQHPPR